MRCECDIESETHKGFPSICNSMSGVKKYVRDGCEINLCVDCNLPTDKECD